MRTTGRREFGFHRTVCDCRKCTFNCSFIPGYLIPADLTRMIPEGADPLAWAEVNLLASPGALVLKDGQQVRIPTLVPATKPDGSCIHLSPEGRCGIHPVAPFGCAFFDCESKNPSLDPKAQLGIIAVMKAWAEDSLYQRIWNHLDKLGKRQLKADILRERMRSAWEQQR